MSEAKSMMLMPNIQETENTPLRNPSSSNKAHVLLNVQGLKKAFGGQVVLDCVDLELRQGEVVLLRGENGSGKTTLLNILTGNLEPDAGAIHYRVDNTPRTYYFPRRWWQELNPFDHFTPEFVAREGVGRTWQDIRLFGSLSLLNNISVATSGHPGENPLCAIFTPGKSAIRERKVNEDAKTLLSQLGLSGREDSSADKISLGQSKRVAIARAVAAGAKVLFLDEPLAGLDQKGIVDVLALLENLVCDHNVTLVIIEHIFNQIYLQDLVNADWLLTGGRLQRNSAKQKKSTHISKRNQTGPERPSWFKLLAGDDAEIADEPLTNGALLTRIRRSNYFKNSTSPVLEIDGLVVKRGSRSVIGLDESGIATGLSFSLYPGEIIIIQAPNGWGKSTLLSAISGLTPAHKGKIYLKQKLISEFSAWDRSRRGVRTLHADSHLFPNLNGLELLKLIDPEGTARVLDVPLERMIATLSGGERQRLGLHSLACLENTTCVYLLDEPLSALDNKAGTEVIAWLSHLPPAMIIAIPGNLKWS